MPWAISLHTVMHSAAPCGFARDVMASKNRVTVNLSDDEAVQLSALAKREKASKAWLGRRAICDLLQRAGNEDQEQSLTLVAGRGGKR